MSGSAGSAIDFDALNRNGFVVVPEVVPGERLAGLDRLVADYLESRKKGNQKKFLETLTQREASDLVDSVAKRAHVSSVIGDTFHCYHHHIALSRAMDPGAREYHRDYEAVIPPSIKVGIYLQDVTETSGSTEFLPGTHVTKVATANPVRIVCGAGDGVIYHPNILHRRAPNAANRDRRGLFLSYCKTRPL